MGLTLIGLWIYLGSVAVLSAYYDSPLFDKKIGLIKFHDTTSREEGEW